MSAVHDFITGVSPQPDPALCKQKKIGYDRVWRVAVTLLAYESRKTHTFWPSQRRLSVETGIPERMVRLAISILEKSGVIERVDWQLPEGTKEYTTSSQMWRVTWKSKPSRLKFDPRTVDVDPDRCTAMKVGVDRVWRVAVMRRLHVTLRALTKATNIPAAQLRTALRAAGLTWRAPIRRRHPSPKHFGGITPSGFSSNELNPESRERAGDYTPPVKKVKTKSQSVISAIIRYGKGSTLMPWDIIKGERSFEPDEDTVPTRVLRKTTGSRKPKPARGARPLDTWSAMDMAREFQRRITRMNSFRPGDGGDVVQLTKIIGRMRKQYGHDARAEMFLLDKMLSTTAETYGSTDVPAWKKFIQRISTDHDSAVRAVTSIEMRRKVVQPTEVLWTAPDTSERDSFLREQAVITERVMSRPSASERPPVRKVKHAATAATPYVGTTATLFADQPSQDDSEDVLFL